MELHRDHRIECKRLIVEMGDDWIGKEQFPMSQEEKGAMVQEYKVQGGGVEISIFGIAL